MDQLFEFNSGFFAIITLYVQTFAVFKVKTSLLPSISHSTLDIIGEISSYNTLMKKYQEKVSSFSGDKDRLKKFLDSFSRSLSWFLGMTAYKLIKVKDEKDQDKKDKEKSTDKDSTSHDKMQDLIIQSNLLSGGIENRFITLFSNEAQVQLQDLIKISQDKKLLQLLNEHVPKETDEDKLITAIIHSGENPHVDRLIGYLQNFLERKIPMVPYARLSGVDGMRVSRAAFGVMIKFSEFYDTFTHMVDEVDMQWHMLEGDSEREIKMKEAVKGVPHYEMVFKRWESASKMRQWVNEKKNNLIEKIKKEVEAEYKKKKDEEKNKAPAAEEQKPAAVEEEKKASEESAIKEEEIVLIDTTSKPTTTEPVVDGTATTTDDASKVDG